MIRHLWFIVEDQLCPELCPTGKITDFYGADNFPTDIPFDMAEYFQFLTRVYLCIHFWILYSLLAYVLGLDHVLSYVDFIH